MYMLQLLNLQKQYRHVDVIYLAVNMSTVYPMNHILSLTHVQEGINYNARTRN